MTDEKWVRVERDSISPEGERLITIVCKSPKFLDAQWQKHRNLSISASSDRAIPTATLLNRDIYIPDVLYRNCPGMSGKELLTPEQVADVQEHIRNLYEITCGAVEHIQDGWNLHKQHINRYLAPWTFQTLVVTGNERWFRDLIRLRSSDRAQPEFRKLALEIDEIVCDNSPTELGKWDWHLPFITLNEKNTISCITTLTQLSASRAARASYAKQDEVNLQQDLSRYKRLVEDGHVKPMEHVARPINPQYDYTTCYYRPRWGMMVDNFIGWRSLRSMI